MASDALARESSESLYLGCVCVCVCWGWEERRGKVDNNILFLTLAPMLEALSRELVQGKLKGYLWFEILHGFPCQRKHRALTIWPAETAVRSRSLMAPRGEAAIMPTVIKRNHLENSTHSATGLSCISRSCPSPHPAVKEERLTVQKASFKRAAELTLKNTSFSLLEPDHEPITCDVILFYPTHLSGRPRASI